MQIWQDYDPEKDSLQVSFVSYQKQGNSKSFEAYFNGNSIENSSPRIFVKGFLPSSKSPKTIIYIKDLSGKGASERYAQAFVEKGFGFVEFDYCANCDDVVKCSRYPDSLSYGNIKKSNGHLNFAQPTAKDSCQYLWTTVSRRVISFVKSVVADSKIILIGAREGADMMWQTAGMDKRVDAVIAINNAGWREYGDIYKYDENAEPLSIDDERERWFAGCASQTYAKYIDCPCLYISGSNNPITSIDRIENTLSLIDNERVFNCTNPNSQLWLPTQMLATQLNFCELFDCKVNRLHNSPTCELSIEENKLIANINIDTPFATKEIALYYAFDELDSTIRNWNKIVLPQNGSKKCEIPVKEKSCRVFAFVNVEYDNQTVLSSYQSYIKLPQDVERTLTRRSHIIYERKSGITCFAPSSRNNYIASTTPYLKAGAYDILGITCDESDITTFIVGEDKFIKSDESLLQFDAYSEKNSVIKVVICNKENGKKEYYTASCQVSGDGEWTKCLLEPSSFKTQTFVPLKSWDNIKSLTFSNINGVLIKSILWV